VNENRLFRLYFFISPKAPSYHRADSSRQHDGGGARFIRLRSRPSASPGGLRQPGDDGTTTAQLCAVARLYRYVPVGLYPERGALQEEGGVPAHAAQPGEAPEQRQWGGGALGTTYVRSTLARQGLDAGQNRPVRRDTSCQTSHHQYGAEWPESLSNGTHEVLGARKISIGGDKPQQAPAEIAQPSKNGEGLLAVSAVLEGRVRQPDI
jgi:hypothetical protein